MAKIEKKITLITGGGEGLGKEIARVLAENSSNKVIILSNNKESLMKASGEISVDPFFCDVTDPEQIEKVVSEIVAKHGKIDCLVNNAGVGMYGPLEDYAYEKIKKVIEVNTLGVIYFSKAVVPVMRKAKKGGILNIISTAALKPEPQNTIYDASKWAIRGFTESLRQELAGNNISVMGLYPATIKDTGIFRKAGWKKDMTHAMDPKDLAEIVSVMLSSDTISFNQVVLRHVNHD